MACEAGTECHAQRPAPARVAPVVAWVPVTHPPGSSTPLLFLPSGEIVLEFHAFVRRPGMRGKSGSTLRQHAEAVSLLYAFCSARGRRGGLTQAGADSLVTDFVEALLYGTVGPDGTDPSGLYWRPRSAQQVSRHLRSVRLFGSFLSAEGATIALNPRSTHRVRTVADRVAFAMRRDHSLLAHLHDPSQEQSTPRFAPFERELAVSSRSGRPIPFPTQLELPFFRDGLIGRRKRNVTGGICPHIVRDTLYFLLLLYGGLRKSEPLHLFVHDVVLDEDTGQGASVFLYHPAHGVVHDARERRANYLQKEYGLAPRNRLGISDPLFAGWKSLLLSETAHGGGLRTRVFWRNPEAGRLFWDLHAIYIRHIRPKRAPHPYYFVALSGPEAGRPMTKDAVNDAFARALKRLGLSPDASSGLSPHAMRHRYAQALVDAKLNPGAIQICLHHRSLASQLAYTRPMPHQVARMFASAAAKIDAGITDFDPSTLGITWRSDPLGIFTNTAPVLPPDMANARPPGLGDEREDLES